MKKDVHDLNMTLDDTSKEIKRLQDELEHCPRRSCEIRAHALLKQKYLRGFYSMYVSDDEKSKVSYLERMNFSYVVSLTTKKERKYAGSP